MERVIEFCLCFGIILALGQIANEANMIAGGENWNERILGAVIDGTPLFRFNPSTGDALVALR